MLAVEISELSTLLVSSRTKTADSDDKNELKQPGQSLTSMDSNPHIGTVHPQEDFQDLINKGISLEKGKVLLPFN